MNDIARAEHDLTTYLIKRQGLKRATFTSLYICIYGYRVILHLISKQNPDELEVNQREITSTKLQDSEVQLPTEPRTFHKSLEASGTYTADHSVTSEVNKLHSEEGTHSFFVVPNCMEARSSQVVAVFISWVHLQTDSQLLYGTPVNHNSNLTIETIIQSRKTLNCPNPDPTR